MVSLRLPEIGDCDRVLEWRNSSEVAAFMYRDDPIPPQEHAAWFPSTIHDRNGARYRVVESESTPIGWISLTNIDTRNRSCEWGGYLAPEAPRGKGLGKDMLLASLDMAFTELGMNRVVVEVIVGNDRALYLYESVGFVREGLLRERAWQLDGPRDVICLALLSRDWKSDRNI